MVGQRFEELEVKTIGLMHGTFVGNDAFGLIREIGRVTPGLSQKLEQNRKRISDKLAGESGNFTHEFATFFADLLNRGTGSDIKVIPFDWSSENNHTGRADGAVRLIDELFVSRSRPEGRLLLLGHSHAGNVFALMTNLLAADEGIRNQFFDATNSFYQQIGSDVIDLPVWNRVQERMSRHSFAPKHFDFVTFGTPVRYGWDPNCIRSLTHFIHHRPDEALATDRVPFPPRVDDVVRAKHGDFVQQVAIAGTDFLPYLLNRRTRIAERKLVDLLQPGLRRRQLLERLKFGQRVHADGSNLLVDYADDDQSMRRALLGHGIYTRREWLVFHAEQIASRLPAKSTVD
jgi:hypothetical protein